MKEEIKIKSMQSEIDLKNDALRHIALTAKASRTATRRLRWIEKRANLAIENKPYNQEEFDLPKHAESAESLKAEIRILKQRIEDIVEFTQHFPHCPISRGTPLCLCGLDKLINP